MSAPHHRVAIVGSGFAGLGAAIRLEQAGVRDFVLLERAAALGGTWRDNTYPGCQCDVPSHLYSFSFAPNPGWTRSFAPQAEIRQYLEDCADRFDVRRKIRFGHEVREARWRADEQRWEITTERGLVTANVLIGGYGSLSEPAYPTLDGLERFEGAAFHSAKWNHDFDLRGKRVGVIGTGASAIQFVPRIQPEVAQLHVFQRTPPWIVPRPDRPLPSWERAFYRRVPFAQKLSRARIYLLRELLVLGMTKRPDLMRPAERIARAHLRHHVRDAALREALTPGYAIGCKRILLSNDYYPAVTRDNVELVTAPLTEVRANGVVTADGTVRELDALIYGTGFRVTDHPFAGRIFGADGRSLAAHWEHGAEAYLGTTIPQFPNLFVMYGPNTGLGHTSMVFMLESQLNYIVDGLRVMDAEQLASVDVSADRARSFNDGLQRELAKTVWNAGCSSWYLDAEGRNSTNWPTFTWTYRRRTRRFDREAYTTEPRR